MVERISHLLLAGDICNAIHHVARYAVCQRVYNFEYSATRNDGVGEIPV